MLDPWSAFGGSLRIRHLSVGLSLRQDNRGTDRLPSSPGLNQLHASSHPRHLLASQWETSSPGCSRQGLCWRTLHLSCLPQSVFPPRGPWPWSRPQWSPSVAMDSEGTLCNNQALLTEITLWGKCPNLNGEKPLIGWIYNDSWFEMTSIPSIVWTVKPFQHWLVFWQH